MAAMDEREAMMTLRNVALSICAIWYVTMAALMLARPEWVARYVARSKMWTTYLTKVRRWSAEDLHGDHVQRLIRVQGLLAFLPILIVAIVLLV
jgi:hypothetical protein